MTHEEIVEARLAEIAAHTASTVEYAALAAFGVVVIGGFFLVMLWRQGTKRRNVV